MTAKKKNPKKKGRKSKYEPDFCHHAEILCTLGATNEDLAKLFKVNVATIARWIKKYPDFCNAIKKGKIPADDKVTFSLFQRAVGYEHKETKAQWVESEVQDEDGEWHRVGRWETLDMIKHYPPDTAANFIWLKNRRPDLWRDKPEPTSQDPKDDAKKMREAAKEMREKTNASDS